MYNNDGRLTWDNIDRLEETIGGQGTSHRVNGIAIQAKAANLELVESLPSVEKTKKRSIEAASIIMPSYNVGQRERPPQTKSIEVNSTTYQYARQKNYIWFVARFTQKDNQSISSWTGFNILTRDDVIVTKDNIGYLPTINAPATKMSTVHAVLNQSLSIMKSLQLSKIVCVS